MQVNSARSLEIETSLTSNIQADANLRLRGTPDRPVVLGNISVNSGQIEFFGNKYTINRGEINFYNPVKIEPNHRHGSGNPGARHHGGHQLFGTAEQAELLLSLRPSPAGQRYYCVAGRGAHALHQPAPWPHRN